MNDNELMKTMPVPQAVAKMAIPSIISSLVTVVYNMERAATQLFKPLPPRK